MATLTTRTEIPDEVGNTYIKEHLRMEVSNNVLELFAKRLPLHTNRGSTTIRVRRYNTLNPATTPLTEGVTPTGKKASVVNIDIAVKQYGDHIGFTDVVSLTSYDDIIFELTGLTGRQKSDTKNTLCRNALLSGTNVVYAGGKTNRNTLTANDKITQEMIDKIELTLKKGKASKVTSMMKTNSATGIEPIDACFVGYISLHGGYQLRNLPNFVPIEKYAQNGKTFPNEIGKIGSIRFIETDAFETITGSVNVEQLIAMGEEAYACVEMSKDGNGTLIIKDLGEGGDDPINQRGSVGWKDYLAYKILNDKFIVRGEFAQ